MERSSKSAEPVSPLRLGFLGMGAMGSRMAGRLIDAKHSLTVFNRTRERTEPLVKRGAIAAETPAALAAGVNFVLSCLTDDVALEEAMFGRDGALGAARPGTVFVEMSTVSPKTSQKLHQAGARKGVPVLDAPVSGSRPQAERGELVIFVGGDEASFAQCRSIFDALGKETFYMGPSGSGAATKLCVNALLGLGIQGLAEAIALGRKLGVDPARLLNAIGNTAVVSPAQKSKLENVRNDSYPALFTVGLMLKDLNLILKEAAELGVEMPATSATKKTFEAEGARQKISAKDEDFSSIIRAMQRLAGIDSGA